jgi:hypothetical protein
MTSSVSLALLLERLHWPVPRVRWETARQLANLIEEGDDTARQMLLAWNAALKLESDAAILPSLIHAFGLQTFFDFDEVNEAVTAPSILSDALVARLYPEGVNRLFSSRLGYSNDAVYGILPERLFETGIGAVVPQIFRTILEAEECRTNLPFLAQWAYEWRALQDRFAEAYTKYPDYFFAGDRGNRGSLDVRQRAVFVSAFLRTLAAAHLEWGMPRRYATGLAEFVLPFNGGLARFEASPRPPWSQDFLGRFETIGAVALARDLWRAAAATVEAGFEPIALDAIDYNENLAVQVRVQRVIEGVGGDESAAELASPVWTTTEGEPWSLTGILPISQRSREEGLRPLCVAVQPEAYARAHIDLLLGRILLADPVLANGAATVACETDRITLTDANGLLSTLLIWYADWMPTHPDELGLSGSLTTCRRSALRDFRRDCSIRTPRLARVRVARRAHSYEPFEIEERTYRL